MGRRSYGPASVSVGYSTTGVWTVGANYSPNMFGTSSGGVSVGVSRSFGNGASMTTFSIGGSHTSSNHVTFGGSLSLNVGGGRTSFGGSVGFNYSGWALEKQGYHNYFRRQRAAGLNFAFEMVKKGIQALEPSPTSGLTWLLYAAGKWSLGIAAESLLTSAGYLPPVGMPRGENGLPDIVTTGGSRAASMELQNISDGYDDINKLRADVLRSGQALDLQRYAIHNIAVNDSGSTLPFFFIAGQAYSAKRYNIPQLKTWMGSGYTPEGAVLANAINELYSSKWQMPRFSPAIITNNGPYETIAYPDSSPTPWATEELRRVQAAYEWRPGHLEVSIGEGMNMTIPEGLLPVYGNLSSLMYKYNSGHTAGADADLLMLGMDIFGAAGVIKSAGAGLTRGMVGSLSQSLEGVASTGRLGGAIYSEAKLAKLEKYLARREVDLARNQETFLSKRSLDAAFGWNDSGVKKIFLKANPTRYEVWHELLHLRDLNRLGVEEFGSIGKIAREQKVYDALTKKRRWNLLTPDQQDHAFDYLLKVGGDPLKKWP